MTGKQIVPGYYAVAWVGFEPTTTELPELFPMSHGALFLFKIFSFVTD